MIEFIVILMVVLVLFYPIMMTAVTISKNRCRMIFSLVENYHICPFKYKWQIATWVQYYKGGTIFMWMSFPKAELKYMYHRILKEQFPNGVDEAIRKVYL